MAFPDNIVGNALVEATVVARLARCSSSYTEQYLISPIALTVLGLVSASSVASFAR
jgi:hypothetical protein